LLFLGFTIGCFHAVADEPPGSHNLSAKAFEQKLGKARLRLMSETISAFKVSEAAPKFTSSPLLRYSDPTRGANQGNVLLDATVWRLGEKGRPAAIITLEIYSGKETTGILSYEFLALHSQVLSLVHKTNPKIAWRSAGKGLPLTAGPPMASTAAARLAQMRKLVRCFEVRERTSDGDFDCRLMTQPIDRYESEADGIRDAALFTFANGTNPEVGILLEARTTGWYFAAIRLSSAALTVNLDGEQVAHFENGDFRGRTGDYSAAAHPIDLSCG
jgi:hypothetical protein